MNWKSNYLEDAEQKIHYNYSDNSKPPLILLHGATDNGMCWIPIADKLAKNYFVIMPDARGHGLTEAPKEDIFSVDRMADDVAFIIQTLQLQDPRVIGHSMGANVALLAGAKYPNLIHKIVLEDPFFFQKMPWYSKPLARLLMKILNWYSLSGFYERIMKKGKKINPTWPEEVFKPWTEAKIQYREKDKNYILDMFNLRYLWRDYVAAIQCPLLLISSSRGLLSDKKAKEALKLCKTATWVKIEGAKHNIRREQPEKFMTIVSNFLEL